MTYIYVITNNILFSVL